MTDTRKKTTQDTILDSDEQMLEDSFESAKPLSHQQQQVQRERLSHAAKNYMTKDKRINIRVYGSDLDLLKRIALREGLPYQTLITSVLHKYATGQFTQNQ